jgi:hypothetical protein
MKYLHINEVRTRQLFLYIVHADKVKPISHRKQMH